MSRFPYLDEFAVHRTMPQEGTPRAEILAMMSAMASRENVVWETGQCSGTMYCGDHGHYDFMGRSFDLFAHVNALQRDMCPSMTKFEGEIIAMTLDLLGAGGVSTAHPAGSSRQVGAAASSTRCSPTASMPNSPRHRPSQLRQARDRPPRLRQGVSSPRRRAAARADRSANDEVDVDAVRDPRRRHTIAVLGSACNYGYGTIDPIAALARSRSERGVGLHVDGCLGGFILPWGQELGYDIPVFDFRVPGVTSISADTHKYGYGFKGSRFSRSPTRPCATVSTSS